MVIHLGEKRIHELKKCAIESRRYFENLIGYKEDFNSSTELFYPIRNFVNLDLNYLFPDDENMKMKEIPIRFLMLDEETLRRIYNHNGERFNKGFTEDGKQILADTLGRKITYLDQPHCEPEFVGTLGIYHPSDPQKPYMLN